MFGYIIQYREEQSGESVLCNYSKNGALQVFFSESDAHYCACGILSLVEYEVVKVDVNFAE